MVGPLSKLKLHIREAGKQDLPNWVNDAVLAPEHRGACQCVRRVQVYKREVDHSEASLQTKNPASSMMLVSDWKQQIPGGNLSARLLENRRY